MDREEGLISLYHAMCRKFHELGWWYYSMSFHFSMVCYHLRCYMSGEKTVPPTSSALFSVDYLIGACYSGCFVVHKPTSFIIQKNTWICVRDILEKDTYNPHGQDAVIISDMSGLHLENFEFLCSSNMGVDDSEYLVYGKYNNLRDIIHQLEVALGKFHYNIRNYQFSRLNTGTNGKTQDTSCKTEEGRKMGDSS